MTVAETYVAQNVWAGPPPTACAPTCAATAAPRPAFHNARTPGELIERIDGDVTALANFFSRFVIQLLGNALLLLGVLALLFGDRLAGRAGADDRSRLALSR